MPPHLAHTTSVAVFLLLALAHSNVCPSAAIHLRISNLRHLLHLDRTSHPSNTSPALFPWHRSHAKRRRRQLFAEDDGDSASADGQLPIEVRAKISDYRLQLTRLKQEQKDLKHEQAFLEKALELKKGQRTMQDGQVKLSQAELADKEKEIAMYRREAPRTLERYNEMIRRQNMLRDKLTTLHQQTEQLTSSKNVMQSKISNLSMEDLLEHHARGLPDAMAGALRKSAAALTPFFDYLVIAADTNNRLVDHVSAEIDRYTHVNISGSPFMSGILFYCVLLIPLLTLFSCVRRIFDTSSRLTVSHYIVLGNFYFIVMCIVNVIAAQLLSDSPARMFFMLYERPFVVSNLLLAMYFVWHVAMLALQAALTMERRNVAQLVATVTVGLHYYLFSWRRIFTDNAPNMFTFNYLIYATIFTFIMHERLTRMSARQLDELALLRFLHSLSGKEGEENKFIANIKNALTVAWTSVSPMPSVGVSILQARRARHPVSRPASRKPRPTHRNSPPDSSADEGATDRRPAPARGLFSRLLSGRAANNNDSSSEDEAVGLRRNTRNPRRSFWPWS